MLFEYVVDDAGEAMGKCDGGVVGLAVGEGGRGTGGVGEGGARRRGGVACCVRDASGVWAPGNIRLSWENGIKSWLSWAFGS